MLKVSDLSFAYGRQQILQNISFEIRTGSMFSVLGLNGSGKTTLLKCLAGLLQPDNGTITLNSRNLSGLSRQERATTVGYLPQHTMPVACSVIEAILTGRKPYLGWQVTREDLDATDQLLTLTGLSHLAHQQVNKLSGGELQRVAIARTLAQQPTLLLLDEPINHLDLRNQIDIMALIRNITAELGIVTVSVMHDLNTALRFSDGFVLLKEGCLSAAGGTETVTEAMIQEVFHLRVVTHTLESIPLITPCPSREPSRFIPQ